MAKKPLKVEIAVLRPMRVKPHNEDDLTSVAPGDVVTVPYADHVHLCAIGKATADPEEVAKAKKNTKSRAKK